MKWTALKRDETSKERDLEDIIRKWLEGDDHGTPGTNTFLAGVPSWFPSAALLQKQSQQAVGYRYVPDGISDHEGTRFVLEFKFGKKGEPIALAEVLHHSFLERHRMHMTTVPVIVGQYNGWTRAALAHLIEDGLPSHKIRYLEVDLLATTDGSQRRVIWFDEPLAPWRSTTPSEVPDEVRSQGEGESFHDWFLVETTATWWGTDIHLLDRRMCVPNGGGRPLFFGDLGRATAITMARSADRAGSSTGNWLSWHGRFESDEEAFWLGA